MRPGRRKAASNKSGLFVAATTMTCPSTRESLAICLTSHASTLRFWILNLFATAFKFQARLWKLTGTSFWFQALLANKSQWRSSFKYYYELWVARRSSFRSHIQNWWQSNSSLDVLNFLSAMPNNIRSILWILIAMPLKSQHFSLTFKSDGNLRLRLAWPALPVKRRAVGEDTGRKYAAPIKSCQKSFAEACRNWLMKPCMWFTGAFASKESK